MIYTAKRSISRVGYDIYDCTDHYIGYVLLGLLFIWLEDFNLKVKEKT